VKGMRTRWVAAPSAAGLNPSPSAPTSTANGPAGAEVAASRSAPAGVRATMVQPRRRSSSRPPGHGSTRAKGTASTWPMDTRTDRR
jgi:hypothetical protein